MLGSKSRAEKKPSKTNAVPASGNTCVLSHGSVFEGKFSSKEDVRLDGLVTGDVNCDSRLVMGEKGKIVGTAHASEAVIFGIVEGDIRVSGALTLKETARIKGNIFAKTMSVEEGATYNGECKIG